MTTRVIHLGHSDEKADAWELADQYAAIVRTERFPLAIGVRPIKGLNKGIPGGFEVYAVPSEVTDTEAEYLP